MCTFTKPILKLLNTDKPIVVSVCDGTKTIAQAKDVFKAGISPCFKNRGLDKQSTATPETVIQSYEIVFNATFKQMLQSLGLIDKENLKKRALTQHQIIDMCTAKKELLNQHGGANLFLVERKDGEFFYVYVYAYGRGLLHAYSEMFGSGHVWNSDRSGCYLFLQQL